MTVDFKLNIIENCILQIRDLTLAQPNGYLSETSNYYEGTFKYIDTYTVNIIKYNKANGTSDVVSVIITPHTDGDETPIYCDEAHYELLTDGYYTIEHIIMFNKNKVPGTWVLYTTDGIDFFDNDLKIEKEEFITIIESINSENTRNDIVKAAQETFSICLLNNTYLQLCNQQFKLLLSNTCGKSTNIDIDLIWITMNAIKYNVELGMLLQAQTLLEQAYKCTGISKLSNTLNNQNKYGCNCCG